MKSHRLVSPGGWLAPKAFRQPVLWPLLFGLTLAFAPRSYGTIVTLQLSGTWSIVNDTGNVLDGSLQVGSNFLATLVYDNTATNGTTGSQAPLAGYYAGAASNHFSFDFTSGNYTFTLPPTALVEIDVDHLFNAFPDEIILYAEGYRLNGPLPAGVSSGFGYANPALQNYAKNVLANNSLIGAPWTINFWPSTDFYLYLDITGAGAGQYLELDGTIDRIVPDPMPDLSSLMVSNADLHLGGSNVVAGNYILVTSTNLSAPQAQWTAVATNRLAGESGINVTATNEFSTEIIAKWYRYLVP